MLPTLSATLLALALSLSFLTGCASTQSTDTGAAAVEEFNFDLTKKSSKAAAPTSPIINSESDALDAVGLSKAQRAKIAAIGDPGDDPLADQKRQWMIQQTMTPDQHFRYSELMHARRKTLP